MGQTLQQGAIHSSQPDSKPFRWFVRVFPYLTLASFAALVFWGVSGLMCFDADDYQQITTYSRLPTNLSEYAGFVKVRGFLPWAYYAMHKAAGDNLDPLVVLFVFMFAASSIYLFYVLKRFSSSPAALAGSLVYLCLASKYRAIVAYNAQLYIPIVLCAILFLHVLTSKLPRFVQCCIITPIYWLTLHFYEILIVLLPIFSCAWLGPSVRNKALPKLNDLLCIAAPIAVTLLHVTLLGKAEHPLWGRNQNTSTSSLVRDLWNLFTFSLDQNFGSVHWHRICSFPVNFFKYDLHENHLLWLPTIATFVCSAFALWFTWKQLWSPIMTITESGEKANRDALNRAVFVAGLYLALFSSLIAIGEFAKEVPSRLLLLSGLGFGLAVAGGLNMLDKHWSFRPLFAAALAWCVMEALTFGNIVQQFISAYKTDREITAKVVATKSIKLSCSTKVFISLPYLKKMGHYWVETEPQFYRADPVLLWSCYGLQCNPGYHYAVRDPKSLQPIGMYRWLTSTLKEHRASDLCPFYLDDKGELRPITKLTIIDHQKGTNTDYLTALNSMLAPEPDTHMNLISEPSDFFPHPLTSADENLSAPRE
jgi:hypothetical protein